MHELSICFNIINTLDEVVKDNQLAEVETIILEIGELTSIVPHYLQQCFPAAVDGTIFEKTNLELEIIKGIGQCSSCGNIYELLPVDGICPNCHIKAFKVIDGQQFNIKEIIAR